MKQKQHLNLIFPQYQGGGNDTSTYFGGIEIKNNYFKNTEFKEITISLDKTLEIKHDILGYDVIVQQLKEAKNVLDLEKPTTIFTIGGGCDADIIPIAYLHKNITSDFTVLWFDAHGDINSPAESNSKLFYGMPIRFLLENNNDKINKILGTQLRKSQLLLIGNRDLDTAEIDYINKNQIANVSIKEIEQDNDIIIHKLKTQNCNNVYIHIDLDVLDPESFPYVPVPSKNGLKAELFGGILDKIKENFTIIGIGLFEYMESHKKEIEIIKKIIEMGKGF